MAIIYTYPVKNTPANDDLILISDSADSNKTKQVKISSLPGGSASGVASLNTLTQAVTITGGTNVTLNTVGNNIEINSAGGGDTYTLQAEAKSNNSVPLKLDAATGTDSTVNLTEGSGVTLTRNSATEITIAATSGAMAIENNGSALASGITTLDFSTNLTPVSAGPGSNKVTITSTDTTYNAMDASTLGLGKLRYATGSTPAAESQSTTANRTYGVTANSSNQLVVNVPWTDTSGISFSGSTANGVATYSSATTANVSANLTFATNTLTLTDTLDIKGDGVNPGTLNLYCESTSTPHAVSILGPQHSGATPYSIRLPKEIATQTAYSSGGRVLESNASGALQWINTPSAGVSPTSGTWYATLANASGQSYASNATQAQIAITTNNCQWYRVGDMMYYQFYIAGTVKAGGTLTGNLFLCRSATSIATNTTTYGLPIDATYNTVVNDGFCNGSVTITESEAPAQALTWTFPVNGGRVGRDTNYAGYVQLFSLLGSGSTNKVYYPLSNQTWLTNSGETPANWALGGTINALVTHQ